jgi:lysozyme
MNANLRTLGILSAILVLAAGLGPAADAAPQSTPPASSSVLGVDVSQFQGEIDWRTVKNAGVAFGIARCADGLSVDPTFAANYEGMRRAGMIRGAYQFFEPRLDPVAQANLILDQMGKIQPGDLPPVLDVEITGGQTAAALSSGIQAWISTVQARIGRDPIVYTNPRFWNSAGLSLASGPLLWVAEWGVAVPVRLPSGWTTYSFWQYTNTGSVPGISGVVDLNQFNGSLHDLRALTRKNRWNLHGARASNP